MTFQQALFWTIATLTGLSAIMVVVTQNIVRAAAWLLFALAGTAGVYFLLGSDFIGAAQLIVYVGGTLVLVVFGVMLTAQGPFVNLRTGAGEWALSLLVGVSLYGALAVSTLTTVWPQQAEAPRGDERSSANVVAIGEALTGVKQHPPRSQRGVEKKPNVSYLLPFEVVSVHLLVVLIAAAYLARAKRRLKSPPEAAA
jgi:NADH-quinone oxidoreductase subunit J